MRALVLLPIAAICAACATGQGDMNSIAERYVQLVLAVGQHDPNFVDAYYGPPEWKAAAEAAGKRPLDELRAEAERLKTQATAIAAPEDPLEALRREYLRTQLGAVAARIRMLSGERFEFDEESQQLYDAVAPTLPEQHFADTLKKLDALLPGTDPLPDRVNALRDRHTIPRSSLDPVFQTAIAACRDRTRQHLELPREEQFTVEYVRDKSWSAYNWYQGGFRSLIQVNTDLPIPIDRAIDLACHEGYPGHHVYNVLLESHLVRGRGWREFTVYPLFSAQSLIAEGTANFGIDVAFPGEERVAFEREHLFPLAGLDPAGADEYYRVMALLEELSYAGNEAARRYLNGEIDAAAAANWLVQYALMSPARAAQRVRFFDQYRSYVINYNLGKDLVRAYVESKGGTAERPADRWCVFGELLQSPRLPSGLR